MRSLSYFLLWLMIAVPAGAGCGYQWVNTATRVEDVSLVNVRNITAEMDIAYVLEEALAEEAGIRGGAGGKRLSVTIFRFDEEVESSSSSGDPVRQKVIMEIRWNVTDSDGRIQQRGGKQVSRTYPWSPDLPTLDWNRSAAIKLMARDAARSLAESLGGRN